MQVVKCYTNKFPKFQVHELCRTEHPKVRKFGRLNFVFLHFKHSYMANNVACAFGFCLANRKSIKPVIVVGKSAANKTSTCRKHTHQLLVTSCLILLAVYLWFSFLIDMPVLCVIAGCKNTAAYKLPADPVLRDVWISFIRRSDPQFNLQFLLQRQMRLICKNHFEPSCFSNWAQVEAGFAKQ